MGRILSSNSKTIIGIHETVILDQIMIYKDQHHQLYSKVLITLVLNMAFAQAAAGLKLPGHTIGLSGRVV